ncbi:MAG: anaerobic ribonucleoside-triphosphate reductase activating protein [Lentisphaerae bacterium]|nr:anaerobic ribonucleoside-triphosphate reductase activating protein [Lentisphaerota bacterium]
MQPVDTEAPSPVVAFLDKASLVDFAGHLSAVFFVGECNFTCGYCHNAAVLRESGERIAWGRIREACDRFRRDWTDAAVVTGGEPTAVRGLEELLRFFRSHCGWAVKLDTNGSAPDRLTRCLPLVDFVAMDVKAAPARYGEITGFPDAEKIRQSARLLIEGAPDYEFRTTVIESFHGEEQFDAIADLLRGARRYVLQPFVPRDDLPDPAMRSLPRTSDAYLERMARRLAGKLPVTIRGA